MAGTSGTPKQAPIRMSTLFSHMLIDCPLDVQVYGKCVADLHGPIPRHACEAEFQKLRACFTRVVRARRV